MSTDTDARYWNTKRAADYLGFSPDTLNRMRLTGDGPRYAKLGGRVIYDRSDIDAWVEANKRSFTHEKNHTVTFIPPSKRLHPTYLHVHQNSLNNEQICAE